MKYFIISILILVSIECLSQKKNIGDKLSSVKFTNLVNSDVKDFDLKKSKSKLLLLDFWSSGCGSCILSMKHLAELKDKWKNDLIIIMLTFDDTVSLNKFFKRRPDIKSLNLPMVPFEKKWSNWFPCQTIPHVVWIGQNHKIEAITSTNMVTEKNIEEYMKNGSISLPEKKDIIFESSKSIMRPKYNQMVYYSSVFSGPLEGMGNSTGNRKMDENLTKFFSYNQTLSALYFKAFQNAGFLTQDNFMFRIQFNISDSCLFEKDKWGNEKRYCYELVIPNNKLLEKEYPFKILKEDLNRYFGFTAEIVKKETEVFVLKSLDTSSSMNKPEIIETMREMNFSGFEAAKLIIFLGTVLPGKQLFYEGPIKKKINITLKTKYSRIEDLQEDLKKAGLCLDKETRKIEFLVVGEVSKKDR